VTAIEEAASGRVAYLTRLGEGIIPGPHTVYQEGDLVHIVVHETDLPAAEALLAAAPPATEGGH
jgi:trk system potassium uptake protein TrkA